MIPRILLISLFLVYALNVNCDYGGAFDTQSDVGDLTEENITKDPVHATTTKIEVSPRNDRPNASTIMLSNSTPPTSPKFTYNMKDEQITSSGARSTKQIDQEMLENENTKEIEVMDEDSESKLFTTLLNLESNNNMSFDNVAKIFHNENKQSNDDNKKRRKERNQKKTDLYVELQDDLVKTEIVKQDSKFKSLGIEPLALMVEERTDKSKKEIKKNLKRRDTEYCSWFQSEDDNKAIPVEPIIRLVKSTTTEQPLQIENSLMNVTHMSSYLSSPLENARSLIPALTVDLAENADLLILPNIRLEIPFSIANNRGTSTRVTITVRDVIGMLLEIDRYIAIIGPNSVSIIRIYVFPKYGEYTDRISFIVTGKTTTTKEILLETGKDFKYDNQSPSVDFTYSSVCTVVEQPECSKEIWTINILARDAESGLKLLTTHPQGIYFNQPYISGTTEEVVGMYTGSCCNPDLEIVAIDRMNNRRTVVVNAYRKPLACWAWILIVLSGLLIVCIVIGATAYGFKKYRQSRGESFELPVYRGGRTRY